LLPILGAKHDDLCFPSGTAIVNHVRPRWPREAADGGSSFRYDHQPAGLGGIAPEGGCKRQRDDEYLSRMVKRDASFGLSVIGAWTVGPGGGQDGAAPMGFDSRLKCASSLGVHSIRQRNTTTNTHGRAWLKAQRLD